MAGGVTDAAPVSSSCTSTSTASTSSTENASSPVRRRPPPPPPPSSSTAVPPSHEATATPLAICTPPSSSASPPVLFHHAPAPPQQFHHHLHQPQQPHQNLQQRLFSGPVASAMQSSGTAAMAMAADRHVRDDCWTEESTMALIEAWGERYMELNRGNLKQKHWKEVALCVNRRGGGGKAAKTDVQCKNRLDTLKKKYKIEKSKLVMGGAPSKWAFFHTLDLLIGPSKKPSKLLDSKPSPSIPFPTHNPNPNPNLFLTSFPTPTPTLHRAPLPIPTPDPHLTLNPNLDPFPVPNPNYGPGTSPFPDPNRSSAADTASKSRSCSPSLQGRRKPSRRKRRAGPCCDPDSGSFVDLASAIGRLAEAYERVEMVKQQQMVELEKQRMELAKDLEIRRLQLFMQTQVELAKLKHGKGKKNSAGSCAP